MPSGFVDGIVGNFADVLNVRMQNDSSLSEHKRRNYKHVFDGLIRITREEGVRGWFRGWLPNSSRAAVQTAGQLASYDEIKRMLIRHVTAEDTLATQISASLLAALITATVTNPIDVIKTRLMSSSSKQGILGVVETDVKGRWREMGFQGLASQLLEDWTLSLKLFVAESFC